MNRNLNSILQTAQLTIGYNQRHSIFSIQEALELTVLRGELVALIGPNGCGKSTLLRTLGGLQPVLKGEIWIDHSPLQQLSIKEKARLISLVLTDKIEISNLSVFELVGMGRNPYTNWLGKLSEDDSATIQLAINQVNLAGFENRSINELSDGERQRALIAKALVQDTPLILLDEPTAHLDLNNRIDIMILLRKLAKETHKAILLSTHELDLALQAADKIWLMKPHDGIFVGTPEDLILTNRLQAVFHNSSYFFDPSTGNFVMNHQSEKEIQVVIEGVGVLAFWTQRALARNGFSVSEHAKCVLTIHEKDKSWTIQQNQQTTQKHSIEEVLELLSSFY